MPGPSNGRKRRKAQGKGQKKKCIKATNEPFIQLNLTSNSVHAFQSPTQLLKPINLTHNGSETTRSSVQLLPEGIYHYPAQSDCAPAQRQSDFLEGTRIEDDEYSTILLREPYIYDPGNGPRVRNARQFLASRYFAQAPALDNPLCAEFAQEEMMEILQTILPEELALILWYNKSRATSRICPTCQRLYHVGDRVMQSQVGSEKETYSDRPSRSPPEQRREQQLSGICSSICFILATINQCDPLTTKAAWGHMANEMDDATWQSLNSTSSMLVKDQDAAGALCMIVRMTRMEDLGLAQLCFPDVDWENVEELDVEPDTRELSANS